MTGVDDLVTWLLIEYAVLGILGLGVLVQQTRERAAWRRLMIHVFAQHPIANLATPTVAELRAPDWMGLMTSEDRDPDAPA